MTLSSGGSLTVIVAGRSAMAAACATVSPAWLPPSTARVHSSTPVALIAPTANSGPRGR